MRTVEAYVWLAIAWLAIRTAYTFFLSPWNLLGDEAYWWVEGQHLALSYTEKGPLLPWLLRAANSLLGRHEGVVRLPMVIASAIAAFGVGWLTKQIYRDSKAALWAVTLYILTPALVANAQICTQDGLMILWFVALAAIGLKLVRRWENNRSTWPNWIAFYATLGAGVLLKQSILLFLSSFVVYAFLRRRHLRFGASFIVQQLAGLCVLAVMSAPLLIWDSTHGWPLLDHTLQHLGVVDGDFASRAKGNPLSWLSNTLGSLVGAAGPALAIFVWASVDSIRHRHDDSRAKSDELFLLCTAWPTIVFYVALSLTKPVVPSWPLPSLVTLIPLAAARLGPRLRSESLDRPTRRWPYRGPMHGVCAWTIGYGAVALLILAFPMALARLPFLGAALATNVLSRFTHEQERADAVAAAARAHGDLHVIVAGHYQEASLLSFYLPKSYVVTCASSVVGNRLSSFDEWDDTALRGHALLGKDILIVGISAADCESHLRFDHVTPIENGWLVGTDYRGPAPTPAMRWIPSRGASLQPTLTTSTAGCHGLRTR